MGELTQIEVPPDGLFVPFEWMDRTPGGSNLGRAEFEVCPKFKGKYLVEYWVYPAQQRNPTNFWHWTGHSQDFAINSYDSLPDAKIWLFYRCREHKTTSFRLSVPANAKFLRMDHYGIGFHIKKW